MSRCPDSADVQGVGHATISHTCTWKYLTVSSLASLVVICSLTTSNSAGNFAIQWSQQGATTQLVIKWFRNNFCRRNYGTKIKAHYTVKKIRNLDFETWSDMEPHKVSRGQTWYQTELMQCRPCFLVLLLVHAIRSFRIMTAGSSLPVYGES